MNMRIGILVGRFQPLHKGHIEAIEFAKNNSDKLYIIVGSAEKSIYLGQSFCKPLSSYMVCHFFYKRYRFCEIEVPSFINLSQTSGYWMFEK